MELQIFKVNNKEIPYYDVSKLSREEWVSFRSSMQMIGGSDVGSICGVNPYMDALTLFYEKIGLKENRFAGNKYTILGSVLEESIRELWRYGNTIEEIAINYNKGQKIRDAYDPLYTFMPTHMDWLASNTDGLITEDPEYGYLGTGILEIKKISGRASDQYEGGIPPAYIFQLQAYMMSVYAKFGYIAALVGETDFITRPFILDDDILDIIFTHCLRFRDAVKLGKEVMAKNIPAKEKLAEIYVIEDTFAETLTSINWALLGEWLLEPINLDQRKDEILLDEAMVEQAEAYLRYQQEEIAAKNAKEQLGAALKREMTRRGAKEAKTAAIGDGRSEPSYVVKFNKRLIVKKFLE